jgi:hypothetical protein
MSKEKCKVCIIIKKLPKSIFLILRRYLQEAAVGAHCFTCLAGIILCSPTDSPSGRENADFYGTFIFVAVVIQGHSK